MALDYKISGERLQEARKQKGFTQEKIAEKLDVSVAYISRVETGKYKLSLKRLHQFCSLLDITEGYLLNGVSDDSEQYLNKEFSVLLKNCPPEKLKLIYDIAQVILKE